MFDERSHRPAPLGFELIVLRFPEPDGASHALTALQANRPHRRWVEEAAVVERHGSGRVSIRGTYAGYDSGGIAESDDTKAGIAFGALGGGVIGLIGGPLGILIGLVAGGALGGVIASVRGGDTSEGAVFDKIRRQLPRGSSALMLLAEAKAIHEAATFGVGEADQVRQALPDDEVEQVRQLLLGAGPDPR
jgi:uncharacterized membrane protein